ncbi:hypothetical protein BASA50_003521 [Batrachochytrium salamandrivorans]|uniref:Uncharacterized protein n=1 Tax=Batrachochytrium salamandrivorans TaxID=1357716 RepID=A0ABQ8FI39_9FUNG|nr:hypothetical protein BASA62_003818 [Batrachochytrium salamandrivorans]KAH6598481.1 hypothetical protein BASA50_003521 [Batrachochytrium salamandrivorans]
MPTFSPSSSSNSLRNSVSMCNSRTLQHDQTARPHQQDQQHNQYQNHHQYHQQTTQHIQSSEQPFKYPRPPSHFQSGQASMHSSNMHPKEPQFDEYAGHSRDVFVVTSSQDLGGADWSADCSLGNSGGGGGGDEGTARISPGLQSHQPQSGDMFDPVSGMDWHGTKI